MAFWDTVKSYLDRGVEVSKDALTKANSAANDFGNTSRLKIEIQQLKVKRGRDIVKLGNATAEKFLSGMETVAATDEGIQAVVDSIRSIDEDIAARQKQLDDAAAERKAAREAAAAEKEAAKAAAATEAAAGTASEEAPAAAEPAEIPSEEAAAGEEPDVGAAQ